MPEGVDPLAQRFNSAVNVVESCWQQAGLRPLRLDARQLASYGGRFPIGWRFDCDFFDRRRRLDVLVTAAFPFAPARIALVDRPSFLTWPHVERDGVLCLVPDHATFPIDDPYAGIAELLEMTFDLIEALIRGERKGDFRSEFLTYWHHAGRGRARTILSLIEPAPPSRIVRIWECARRTIIADNDDTLRDWLRNFAPAIPAAELRFNSGLLVWMDVVLLPSEYPSSAKDVHDIAARAGIADHLDELAREMRQQLIVMLGSRTENGPALATTVVNRPKIVRGSDPLIAGFRPSCVPYNVLHARLFGGNAAERTLVERVDPTWVHGRDRDPRIPTLRGATVAVLGCGSVGGPVAMTLARAGVGKVILVDKQTFTGANVGRHPLGVGSVGAAKTIELAKRIRSDLPHINVECHNSLVQDLLLRADCPLAGVDLIVSALGDWPSESLLDEWQAVQKTRRFPIVYGWTEPHAAAGHAIVISGVEDRLRDGLDATGLPHLVATRWAQETRRYEPACGAAFDPYGPVELGFITSMVAQTTLDALLGQAPSATHRIWLARRTFVEAAGGAWSDELRAIAPQALDGATMVERRWSRAAKDLAA
ncbi:MULTISPECIES: ThiF family adenylyltransferase [unclassified Mesorhizobium]|uniref:ThiF family adenylyltransferase n=1 Tax=unclassified Mesorhizobium TaxID=325217 RepID=UPI003335DA25